MNAVTEFPTDELVPLSVIVPTWNRSGQAIAALERLCRQVLAHDLATAVEILVVDDGSAGDVVARVQEFVGRQAHPFLRYLPQPEHRGASAARVAGAHASRGRVLAFIDDDVVPAADYLPAIIRAHDEHPDVLVINGNLRALNDDVYSRFWFHYYDAVFNRPGEQFYPVEMLASGHFSLKRRLLELVSPLFDTSLTSREDYDLYLRLDLMGIPVLKDDRILAFNNCRNTLYGFIRQRLWYGRGQEQLVAKHGAAFLADRQQRYAVPPNPEYLHLYVSLRAARRMLRLYHAARALLTRARSA